MQRIIFFCTFFLFIAAPIVKAMHATRRPIVQLIQQLEAEPQAITYLQPAFWENLRREYQRVGSKNIEHMCGFHGNDMLAILIINCIRQSMIQHSMNQAEPAGEFPQYKSPEHCHSIVQFVHKIEQDATAKDFLFAAFWKNLQKIYKANGCNNMKNLRNLHDDDTLETLALTCVTQAVREHTFDLRQREAKRIIQYL